VIGDRPGLRTLDPPLQALFDRVAGLSGGDAPDLAEIGAALVGLAADVDYLAPWIARLGGRSGSLPIHAPARGPRLMLVHRSEGQMSAIHDHGTWVAISPIVGTETHRRWRVLRDVGAPRVEVAEDRRLAARDVATLLPPDDVHDHGHLVGQGAPAHVLILLGDDQTQFTRNEWDATTGRHRVLLPGDGGRWLASERFPRHS
jgi:predicted metal-dependent enzyme (double-stranded beta helix superfamily)